MSATSISSSRSTSASYRKLYADLFVEGSNLLRLEKDELQEYIYENYRDFIALQGEYDQFFSQFGEIKSQFSSFENSLRYIFENVAEVAMRKSQAQQKKIQQQFQKTKKKASSSSSDSDDEEVSPSTAAVTQVNAYEKFQLEQKKKQEQEAISEQIFDLLDNVSISAFERKYTEAIKTLALIKDMKKSDKYSRFLDQKQIRKTLESHYQTLTDAIVGDIITDSPAASMKTLELVQLLITLKQTPRAAQAYLEVKRRKLGSQLSSSVSKLGKLEGENTERLTEEYVTFILSIVEEFKQTFASGYLSFLSNWVNESCSVYFFAVQQNIFWGAELEDMLENVKLISNVLYSKEQQNLSLNFIMQRLFVEEILAKMDEMLVAYAQRLQRMQNFDDWQVFTVFSVLNVNFCEDEIGNPRLQPITFFSETDLQDAKRKTLMNIKPVLEVKITKPLRGYQSYLTETQLKAARHAILFWNTIFQLIDHVVNHVDIEQRRIFSAQFIALVESKIQTFIQQYIASFKEVLQSVGSFSESQLLGVCANANACLKLTKLSMEYEAIKLSNHIRLYEHSAWQDQWKVHIGDIDSFCFDLLFAYFKSKLLNHIPRLFSEYLKVYTGSNSTNSTASSAVSASLPPPAEPTPSGMFLKIAAILANIKENLYLIMSQNDMIYYLGKLLGATGYLLEYIIYWEYHQLSGVDKPSNLFFLSANQIARLGLNVKGINQFLSGNAVRIGYFSNEGLKQFIFDMHFLSVLFNESLCKDVKPDKKISYDQFLNKAVSCYCKKKGKNITEYSFLYAAHKQSIQNYCMKSYSADINQIILSERDSMIRSQTLTNSEQQITDKQAAIKERIFAVNLAISYNFQ